MAREFDKNMFVMLFAIMIGTIIITYFVADIVNKTKMDTLTEQHSKELSTLRGLTENFTSAFIKSSVILDQAREDRAYGNYHFDLGFIWYNSALSERNETNIELYKTRGIDNCTNALPYYYNSRLNFEDSQIYFNEAKLNTNVEKYIEILDLYISLTDAGSELTMLRYNATIYLKYLTENITFNPDTGNATYLTNVTELLGLFNQTMMLYSGALSNYNQIIDEIDEYEFFEEIR